MRARLQTNAPQGESTNSYSKADQTQCSDCFRLFFGFLKRFRELRCVGPCMTVLGSARLGSETVHKQRKYLYQGKHKNRAPQ
jgi:hypothetical protein